MLRLSELYTSVQGEGPRTGTPTIFVRFAGCNMRCPGWPCDTEYAIDPSIWRVQSEQLSPIELATRINSESFNKGATNICLTGGEPFLQSHSELEEFLRLLQGDSTYYSFEVFTNGSFLFPEWTKDPQIDMLFNLDWKLGGSEQATTNIEQRTTNALLLGANDCVKFVIKTEQDLFEAVEVANELHGKGFKGTHWIGRVWDAPISNEFLIGFVQRNRLRWNLNVQIHKYIWPADIKGV